MTSVPLRVGTRGSALALWQTELVRARLRAGGRASERLEIRTTGDLVQQVPLSRIGSRAIFTRQIDDALLERRIDLAVHSLKDLPTTLPEGLVLAAVAERDDPRDALIGRGPLAWRDLPRGATLATSSLRRRAQLLHIRPDLTVVDLRGNVDTRLAKLDRNPDWTGILLAAAGLLRLGLEGRIGERLPPEVMLPAPGQGALAVTARAGDEGAVAAARAAIHHQATAVAVAAERAFLRRVEGGCQVPVGALAGPVPGDSGAIELRGRVVSLGGERAVDGAERGIALDEASAELLGVRLADRLLADGGAEILAQVRSMSGPPVSEP